jgi:hypothetical protein
LQELADLLFCAIQIVKPIERLRDYGAKKATEATVTDKLRFLFNDSISK